MPLAVQDIPFFKGLSEKELISVQTCLKEKSFAKGETLFLEGATCERVFFVKSGRIKIFRLASSGREQILETLNSGDTCACNPGSTPWHCASSAEAVAPSTVWFLSRDHYVKLVSTNSKLAYALNRLFAERLRCFSSLIEEVSLKDSKTRLVKFLLDLLSENSSKSGEDIVSVPFTQEEIAKRIGVVRETAARQLRGLRQRKLIDIQSRRIVILDKKGLEKLLHM